MTSAVSLDADGHCVLVAPNEIPDGVAADEVATYPAQWCCTIRQEQIDAATENPGRALSARPDIRCLGLEFATGGQHARVAGPRRDDVQIIDLD